MAVITLEAVAVGTHDQWLLVDSDKTTAVQLPDDDATSYIKSLTNTHKQSFTVDTMPASVPGSISTHTLRTRHKNLNNTFKPFLLYNAAYTYGAQVTGAATWEEDTDVDLAVPGGGTWSTAIINATEMGVEQVGVNQIWVTTMEWIITFTPPSGGFAHNVVQWLIPLMAAASHGLMKHEIVQILAGLNVRPSSREEFARLLEAFQVRPAFSF